MSFISGFTTLSEESVNALSSIVLKQELPKGHVLVKANSICNKLYFIEKGLTRTFYLKDGKDVTDWISIENSFAVSVISILTREPDRRSIELLEPSIICTLDYFEMEEICKRHHEVEHLMRQILSFGFVELQRKIDNLHFSSAKERYDHLISTKPTIIQRVPLGMVASFLGITQETLSRIRAQK